MATLGAYIWAHSLVLAFATFLGDLVLHSWETGLVVGLGVVIVGNVSGSKETT